MSATICNQYVVQKPTMKNKKSIIQELKGFVFLTDEVICAAEGIYHRMVNDGVHRVRIRNMMLYECVKRAYISLGITFDPNNLAAKFDLTNRDKKQCDSLFSALNTGCSSGNKRLTTDYFIDLFFENLSISKDLLPFIEQMLKVVKERNPVLMEEKPRTLAAGFLKYFIEINNLEVNDSDFYRIVDRSPATVNNIKKRIADVYNKM